MGRTPQESLRIEHRRQEVAEFYLKGWTQAAIACELAVSQATVSDDLKAVRRQWRLSQVRDFDEAVQLELRKLEILEREAWSGWQRSQQPAESTRVTQSSGDRKAEKTVRQQQGDPRFLELVHRCIAGRRALLGLDAPTRIAPTSPDGDEAYHAHVMQELMKLAEQSPTGPVVIDEAYVQRQLEGSSTVPTEDGGSVAQPMPTNQIEEDDDEARKRRHT